MHKIIDLPYDTSHISVQIPEKNLKAIITPPTTAGSRKRELFAQKEEVLRALKHPIDSMRLQELSVGKKNIVIITSDHTRPLPSAITLPLLLDEIRSGNPDACITIIVATGLHRGMTHDEMVEKFGEEIVAHERIINHDCQDKEQLIHLGTLPSTSKCEINKIAVESDLLIAEGFIEPHFFAGFSGGRKSVLPGIASQDCVNINHSAQAIGHPKSITGVLDGNPIHEDMVVAAKLAHLSFILNVVLDEHKQITKAFAGDFETAHITGCNYVLSQSAVDAVKADIVITTNGGYPLDQNLYQCPKGLSSALACANEGAVIILAVACRDGLGGENFGTMMQEGSPEELLERVLAIPPEKTISEQWCVQRFAEALKLYSIILVSLDLGKTLTENMNFIFAKTIEEAVQIAFELKGPEATVTVIPDGVSVITRS